MTTLLGSIKPYIPRAILQAYYNMNLQPDHLFNGNDEAFKRHLAQCRIYGEYGCGKTTRFVANNTNARIYAVDTDPMWKDYSHDAAGFTIGHVDIGEVKDWGYPASYEKRDNFQDYTDFLWVHDDKPDMVLVDGRFRVCCFLTTLLNANSGTVVVFDDYTNRPIYHVVEEIIRPEETCGRQAVFIVPDKSSLNIETIETLMERFRYVMD
ncbi:class I SAM-dependent methyltransferase [Sulfitobacter sp. NAS-14.1]|uniref:class I SAM-dependent methyltransferase n=1 Tax=Sulfitobacter TaxID=60136 RepID=UPI000325CB98|nr:class I SAM-dependent methyltransferase [Sulfitobacter sp. NAS-14.1]